jgi:hypothetical protein
MKPKMFSPENLLLLGAAVMPFAWGNPGVSIPIQPESFHLLLLS